VQKKQKGIKPLIKIRRFPLIIIRFLFAKLIISHLSRFVNIFREIYPITFREVEKRLPCVNGRKFASKFARRSRDGGL
jgi:hypothetical protein